MAHSVHTMNHTRTNINLFHCCCCSFHFSKSHAHASAWITSSIPISRQTRHHSTMSACTASRYNDLAVAPAAENLLVCHFLYVASICLWRHAL